MIANDQPDCFPENVVAWVSSKEDGSLLNRAVGVHNPEYIARRQQLCHSLGLRYGDMAYQRIKYNDSRTYHLIAEVDAGSTTDNTAEIVADALYTTTPNVGLFLPVADCAATVIYDKRRHALALAHLGRHSTYAKLAPRLVKHFINDGSSPGDLVVWMSPHAQKSSYKLDWFDRASDPEWRGFYDIRPDGTYLDMAGYNKSLMTTLGVLPSNVYVSPVDTVTDSNYFSHSSGDVDGRIAVVAMLR